MINIEVLDEQLLNMPLVVFIRVSGLFYESKLFGIENFSDLKCFLGNIHGILDGLELKIREEKSKSRLTDLGAPRLPNPLKTGSDRPWHSAPPKAPQTRYVHQDLVLRASQNAKVTSRPHSFPIFLS